MKKLFLVVVLMISAGIILAQSTTTPSKTTSTNPAPTVKGPKAEWEATTIDLGNVDFMVPKDAEFKVTNTGNEPLLITSARAGCGCTNLRYSQEPILPGKSATVAVTFNGSGNGPFRKTITIQTNASDQPTILSITGTVVKKE